METSNKILIEQTLKKLKDLTSWAEDKSSSLSETIAMRLKKLPELRQYINENDKDKESKIFFEIGKYLKYSRYRKGKFIKHSYDSDNFFYMIFSGNIAKINIKYIRTYLTFKEYLMHLIKLKLLGENYIYKKIIKKNKKIFPFDENIDLTITKNIKMDNYDEFVQKIKDEINNSPWNQDTKEINDVSDFIELYNPKLSKNNLSFIGKESKYPTFLPMYVFDKILKPISFIGQLSQPKGIKSLSTYVCLSSSSVFYINKEKIDKRNNLYALFQRKVSEDIITNLFEGHFLFQDTDINFLSKNYSKYFYIRNFHKGQQIISQNTPNEGIYFINKGVFQLKSRRTYHELNELKYKVMQALNNENKNNLTEIENSSNKNKENVYEGINPMQIENLTKERDITFNVIRASDVIGLEDIYDIETGLNNFSVECISYEGETYFLPREILTSMRTNETIDNNIRELVGKQCLFLLREINNNKNSIENSMKNISNNFKENKSNAFYLRKFKNFNNSKNSISMTLRNSSLDFSSFSNNINLNTYSTTNFSNNYNFTIKENSLKNSIRNKYNNKIQKFVGSRILSSKILSFNKEPNLNLKLKTNSKNKIYKIKVRNNQKIRNLNSIEPLFEKREKIKPLKIFNEENKNEMKNDYKYKLLKPKYGYDNKTDNRNINNIFNRKSSGKKRIIKNLIPIEKPVTSKSIKIINNSRSDKKLIDSYKIYQDINKKIIIKSN